ncbi:TetR/AcrR family transcriptional regulator [Amycolatopsis dendrobii]|uniref:TetR/AcrR family transcriptional regulator n=1 Tax=Amycolatopsis dendrobii TaxID=2760662 RepID=A0A7W3W6K5_9PSEU|nr:TetR/AcrR family transcriptional regulator [Amycolatopsis dendrobii]MBB1159796.1 TetR/AcrR family transcriptional regulator [Amycolatopsis dendrobii]
MPEKPTRLRTDAAHNRAQILDVAKRTFETEGLDVSMSELARRAGLGVATVYRHFPTKADLVADAFAEPMAECAGMLDEALADPDPWRGFCRVIEEVCAMQARNHGFSAAIVTALPEQVRFAELRDQALRAFTELIRRAQDAGALRADFAVSDLSLILLANGGLRSGAGAAAPAASRRLAGYLLQSFRAEAATPLPPPAELPLDVSVL